MTAEAKQKPRKRSASDQRGQVNAALLETGMWWPERIVMAAFSTMPRWLRISTYIVALALLVFTFLMPGAIGGRVDKKVGSAREHYKDAIVSLTQGSLRYYVRSENGTWQMLMPSRVPASYQLDFAAGANPEVGTPVQVCPSDFFPGHTLEVLYHEDGNGARFTRADEACSPPAAADRPVEKAGDSVGWSVELISSAMAQELVRIKPPVETAAQVTRAVQQAKLVRDDGSVRSAPSKADLDALSRELDVPLTGGDIAYAKSDKELTAGLVRKINEARASSAASSIYMYAGDVDDDGNWTERYFSIYQSPELRPFQAGDVVAATANVNMRRDYIRFGFFGWQNADKAGVAKPGDIFVVRETKLIGRHVWLKAVPAQVGS